MNNSNVQVQLADVAEIIMGQSPKGETYNKIGEGVPLLNGPSEFGQSHPTPALWTNAPTRLCKEGGLLFCVRGSTTGRMNWADREYCLGRGVSAFRSKTGNIDTRFIYYSLIFELRRLLSLSAGSVFPNLSRQDFERFTINWPEKYTRSAIASILGALDDKIELNRKINETIDVMARAIFKSWFVDFEPIPGLGPHKEWQDSPLGRSPKGWKVESIRDIAELYRDTINPSDFPEEVYEYFSIPAFDGGQMPTHDLGATIKSNKFILPEYCVLISKLNPRIPRVWFVNSNRKSRAVASTEFLVLVAKPPYSNEFLYSLCNSEIFQENFISLVTGTSSSHQRVQPSDLLSMRTIRSSDEMLDKFKRKVFSLFQLIRSNKNQSHTLAAIRNVLMPKLLSGEIRVKNAERFMENIRSKTV